MQFCYESSSRSCRPKQGLGWKPCRSRNQDKQGCCLGCSAPRDPYYTSPIVGASEMLLPMNIKHRPSTWRYSCLYRSWHLFSFGDEHINDPCSWRGFAEHVLGFLLSLVLKSGIECRHFESHLCPSPWVNSSFCYDDRLQQQNVMPLSIHFFFQIWIFLVAGSQTSGKTIWLRNQLLEMLLSVISSPLLHLSSE